MPKRHLLPLLMLGILFLSSGAAADSILIDDFETDLSRWEENSFQGKNVYRLVLEANGNRALQVDSQDSASALIQNIEFDPVAFPRLRWRWKISSVLPSGDARVKQKDDYPARVYVIFPHFFKPLSRSINYIWANRLNVGEVVPSLYFQRSVMLAVESGNQLAGEWVEEERNLLEDYRRVFGEDPPLVGGIAIMTDSDDTGESARAWYDDLQLLKAD